MEQEKTIFGPIIRSIFGVTVGFVIGRMWPGYHIPWYLTIGLIWLANMIGGFVPFLWEKEGED